MSELLREVRFGDNDERGHCKGSCLKWIQVRIEPAPKSRLGPKYWLVFEDSKPCTCTRAAGKGG
jgi:hypothetical protein